MAISLVYKTPAYVLLNLFNKFVSVELFTMVHWLVVEFVYTMRCKDTNRFVANQNKMEDDYEEESHRRYVERYVIFSTIYFAGGN